jgi:hypothetical protein
MMQMQHEVDAGMPMPISLSIPALMNYWCVRDGGGKTAIFPRVSECECLSANEHSVNSLRVVTSTSIGRHILQLHHSCYDVALHSITHIQM